MSTLGDRGNNLDHPRRVIRKRDVALFILASLCASVLACSEDAPGADEASAGTSSEQTGSSGDESPSGSQGAEAASSDLSGTWDVIVSGGVSGMSTVTVSDDVLQIAGGVELLALVTGDALDVVYEGTSAKGGREAAANMDLGVIPLGLGGTLALNDVRNPTAGCTSSFTPEDVSIACTTDADYGYTLFGIREGSVNAHKNESLDSVFGELGGRWSVTSGYLNCDATLQGNTLEVACVDTDPTVRRSGELEGTVTATLDGDSLRGVTDGGIAFTAQRR